jgi:hypothetical protein
LESMIDRLDPVPRPPVDPVHMLCSPVISTAVIIARRILPIPIPASRTPLLLFLLSISSLSLFPLASNPRFVLTDRITRVRVIVRRLGRRVLAGRFTESKDHV